MTLITKLKGQLVHINNQQWPERFQSIAQWEKTWRSTYGRNGAVFNVFVMTKRIIGFNLECVGLGLGRGLERGSEARQFPTPCHCSAGVPRHVEKII